MRAAPPVDVPVSAAGVERTASALLYAAAAAAAALGAQSLLERPIGLPALIALAVCAAVSGWYLWRPPAGRLRWDGRAWSLVQASGQVRAVGQLQLQVDLGRWVLLRWRGEGEPRTTWASLRAADAGAAWHGLRVALAAHSRTGGAP